MDGHSVKKPKLVCFPMGRSYAPVSSFLDDKSLGRNILMEYNDKYKHKEVYYEDGSTNCCRLVMDLLCFLKMDPKHAYVITAVFNGNEKWDKVSKKIMNDYGEFAQGILKFWTRITKESVQDEDLRKIRKLINGQYKLDQAMDIVAKDSCCI